jgi:4,5-dihydroxyphthalate decarboxylase
MSDLELTGAFGDYDRTHFLDSNGISPSGVNLRILKFSPSDIFYRMCRYQEFDLSEMSMGAHLFLLGKGNSPFVGIPAFPSRVFRHSMVYANSNSGIKTPSDLNGKKIGIREWGMTAVVWIIGILKEEYGLDIKTVDWVSAKEPRVPIEMPDGCQISLIPEDTNLSDMLEKGEIDAALIHQVPLSFLRSPDKVVRLFPDYKNDEINYYKRTEVHPIMHCVVLRKQISEKFPWLLKNLYTALEQSRKKTIESLSDTGALSAMIPFLPAFMEETRSVFGENYWPYGVNKNRKTLEKLTLYAHEQGLTDRVIETSELFGESVSDI